MKNIQKLKMQVIQICHENETILLSVLSGKNLMIAAVNPIKNNTDQKRYMLF